MPLFYIRSAIPFPQGDNLNHTDVVINEIHFNRTALEYYNYTLYSNGTLSNGTDCYLAFGQFQPAMSFWQTDDNGTLIWPLNGTWDGSIVNGTSCYAPIRDLGQHAILGMVFALLFALCIVQTMGNLRKHGRRYLPVGLRRPFRASAAGRRSKWLWVLFVAVCGAVSCFMGIDVDRDYLQTTPLMLQGVSYMMMTPGLMAAVWESVRHWGSWQERHSYTGDPYKFTPSSISPSQQEFWLPFLFYLCVIVNFILTIPRGWGTIQLQNSPEDQAFFAKPTATDVRFKTASFLALAGTLIICYSLEHSIHRHVPRPRTGKLNQSMYYFNAAPSQFLVAIALLGMKIGYSIASAFDWSVSPLRYQVGSGWMFGLGYTPALLILVLFNICGWCEVNEDKLALVHRDKHDTRTKPTPTPRPGPTHRHRPDTDTWWKSGRLSLDLDHDHDHDINMMGIDPRDLERYVELGVLGPSSRRPGTAFAFPSPSADTNTSTTAYTGSSISTGSDVGISIGIGVDSNNDQTEAELEETLNLNLHHTTSASARSQSQQSETNSDTLQGHSSSGSTTAADEPAQVERSVF